MKRLTVDEQKKVEEHFSLIGAYCGKNGLDYDDYFGELAEVLCKAVQTYKPDKGATFSTYFFNMAKWSIGKARKQNKDIGQSTLGIGNTELESVQCRISFDEGMILKELVANDKTGIINLRIQGYTQQEIADMLGYSQTYVNFIISKVRREHFDG